MILKIKNAFDTVKPDPELIAKTELLLRAEQPKYKRRTSPYRNLAVAASLLLVIGAASFAGYSLYQTPVTYLDVDINPSLELGINALSRVVDVRFFNTDAEKLVDEHSLSGLSPDEAVGLIVAAADEQGYIGEDETTVVSLAAVGGGDEKTNKMLETCTASAESGRSNVAVYRTTLSDEMKNEADAASISAGKLNLIKMIQRLDDTATIDEYRDTSVTKIFGELKQLTSDDSSGAPEEIKKEIRNNLGDLTSQFGSNAYNIAPIENILSPTSSPSSSTDISQPSKADEQDTSVTKPVIAPIPAMPDTSGGNVNLSPQPSTDTQNIPEPGKDTPAPSGAVNLPSPPPKYDGQKPGENQPPSSTTQ